MTNASICSDCADKAGWKDKDKAVGMWVDQCSHCHQKAYVTAERDYIKPGQRPVTLDDILIYEANND